jgi:hypothetical protein
LKGVALCVALALWQSIDTEGVSWAAARWLMVSAALGCALASGRWILAGFVFRNRLASHNDRLIIVGDPWSKGGRLAIKALEERPGSKCVGWLSEHEGESDYLGHPSAVWEVLSSTGADTVLLCGDLQPELFDTVVEAAAVSGCRVLAVHQHETLTTSRPRALRDGNVRMLELTFPAGRAGQDVVKRAFDAVGAALAWAKPAGCSG